ncbi:uncharacterized protein BJ212DRAFT_1276273 [Suillus subaureus]|uniref:Uncharacterized protein n=1 Tax=Suillus subaureus TaxID=48587 RepID=A0A9P7E6L3_9AGAM|nr:uncharacterized protein BJ212DRAFT_1276273 [Suillus subaureus]KAG1812826.1 hypothetical protein BJ212DRAFT_1276273 [Suillus subaureus]
MCCVLMCIITCKVAGLVLHSIAILCTIARLIYRAWTGHFWWEDAWAAVALVADVPSLACLWLDHKITCEYLTSHSNINRVFISLPAWIVSITFTSVLWAARMSIIFSAIRVANHSGCKTHKQITYLIAASFACMWAGLIAQKMSACEIRSCIMPPSVALSQLITDIIADVSLVAAPLYLWSNIGLSRSRQILVYSAFGASLLITAITIPHSIMLSMGHTPTTLILAYVKASTLPLFICNLLVIVTFLYRICLKETVDLDQSFTSNQVFTSVILTQMPSSTTFEMSLSVQEGTTSRQKTVVQTGATKPKDEDANTRYAEEGTNPEG